MSVVDEITCVWEASVDALKVAASSLTFKCLETTARSVHVKIPATARSRDGMGSLLAMHLSISIEKEKYMAGGVLSSAAKISLLSRFGEFLLSLSKALQGQPSEKKSRSQKWKDKRFCAKADKMQKASAINREYDDLWPQIPSDELSRQCCARYRKGTTVSVPDPCASCSRSRFETKMTLLDVYATQGPPPLLDKLRVLLCEDCNSMLGKGRMPRFALANGLYRGILPDEFKDLTWVEEMVCSVYRTTAHVTRLYQSTSPSDPLVFHGNTCAHDMNVVSTATVLPRTPVDIVGQLSVVFVGPHKLKPQALNAVFRIRKAKVWRFLIWLQQNNDLYRNLPLSMENLNMYSEDGIPEGLDEAAIVDEDLDPHDVFEEETAGVEVHPASAVRNDEAGDDPAVPKVFLEAMGVSDPEASALRNIVSEDSELPDLVIARGSQAITEYKNPALFPVKREHFDSVARRLVTLSPTLIKSVADHIENEGKMDALSEQQLEVVDLLNRVNSIASHIPGSQAAKLQDRNKIRSYMGLFGLPPIFFTMNTNAAHSPLFQVFFGDKYVDLSERYPVLVSASERAMRLAKDPVAAADFFNFCVTKFFEYMLGWDYKANRSNSEGGILGKVRAFFGTCEYTERANLHGHFLIWLIQPRSQRVTLQVNLIVRDCSLVGVFNDHIEIQFRNAIASRNFVICRTIRAEVGNREELEKLKPKTEYQKLPPKPAPVIEAETYLPEYRMLDQVFNIVAGKNPKDLIDQRHSDPRLRPVKFRSRQHRHASQESQQVELLRLNAATQDYETLQPPELKQFHKDFGLIQPDPESDGMRFHYPNLQTVLKFKVVVTTCVTAGVPSGLGVKPGHFDWITIDEVGQAAEPEGHWDTRRAAYAFDGIDDLRRNFRNHPSILQFPNEQFYSGDLEAGADPITTTRFVGGYKMPNPNSPSSSMGSPVSSVPVLITNRTIYSQLRHAGQDQRESTLPSYFNSY
ncbi:hypothetical protein FRC05_010513 [Tulasnella sp. 425]|nr:hypothetical protein FRC05_010513 [Tulasnella sp. 425]